MARLAERIRSAVAAGRFVVGAHADERLRERCIAAWQMEAGMAHARLVRERPGSEPHPAAEFVLPLADGTTVTAVWSYLEYNDAAKLVTVFFPR